MISFVQVHYWACSIWRRENLQLLCTNIDFLRPIPLGSIGSMMRISWLSLSFCFNHLECEFSWSPTSNAVDKARGTFVIPSGIVLALNIRSVDMSRDSSCFCCFSLALVSSTRGHRWCWDMVSCSVCCTMRPLYLSHRHFSRYDRSSVESDGYL